MQQLHFEMGTTLADHLERQLAHNNTAADPLGNFLGPSSSGMEKLDVRKTKTQPTIGEVCKYCSDFLLTMECGWQP